ncbi:D-alanine--D-alanine ligase family protein [Afifella marina]|uniref:D-alanine--D-alanine ligase n=1 Tax=Afifella marina DSM 2698 TaxID=1120955 RepID=A0A1G5NBW1_AFIMA|nr:D-alanine--D-alanine ligase family protein [Afifella marina]MBK1623129.1 D-alanine--D-alanine ligase [Afifella marina DSM 2698]MBK1626123.1 D-alanine--D-alanine ligase [Afifella marina]MBK5917001.1 D-alanine--D-alanine ligase A [Afifella marina]RAI22001.1 D-alanine--D-alanine ligase A [Afifella marina DSM 2698]SCZ34261.1 D-alanine-D-alanine ligase [Afifella marina DSM 2698]
MTPSSSRTRIAVLFGGRSAEHDVSIMSATNVMRALDPETYDLVPIFITRDGRWIESRFEASRPTTPETGTELALLPGGKGRMLALPAEGPAGEIAAIDILFPVLHGLFGEDGSVQGLAEAAGVAFVGCGILGSATAIDKDIAKRLLTEAGLPVARAVTIAAGEAPSFADIEGALGLPLFLKPARQGSSVGVSKVTSEAGFAAALAEGFRHDTRLLAEEFIAGREIECAVLEDPKGELFVSRPGEIVPAERHGFYSYDAKYIDETGAALKVPADLPAHLEAEIRTLAAKAFRALGCDGMARVDFFVTGEGRILVNELNTIPGFTDISMYSKAMAASGVGYAEVIDRLVQHGLARAARSA